jgi:nicotinamidase-related amidase
MSLRARTLIIGGMATDICVLFMANDAYMRDYRILVPRILVPADCVAAETSDKSRRALAQMREALKAATGSSKALRLPARVRARRDGSRALV